MGAERVAGGGGAYAGACVRTDRNGKGVCVRLQDTSQWQLLDSSGALLASGAVSKDVSKAWTMLTLNATGSTATISIDGSEQPPVTLSGSGAGMVSVNSGYNVAYFDNFALE